MSGVVTSAQNARVVAARGLRLRKERLTRRAFLVEGPRAAAAAIAARPDLLRELFITEAAAAEAGDWLEDARRCGAVLTTVSERVAASIAETQHPQGVVAVVSLPTVELSALLDRSPQLVVVLVGASDPGNVGTVIRTADAAGADGVVLTTGSADAYGGKCVRASAGSVLHIPVVTDVTPDDVVAGLRSRDIRSLATTLDGTPLPQLGSELAGPTAWLFGSEAHGLDAAVAQLADRRVGIPIYGRAESLNLAAAAAVCLYASAAAQRG